jgi:hypothetical protein
VQWKNSTWQQNVNVCLPPTFVAKLEIQNGSAHYCAGGMPRQKHAS